MSAGCSLADDLQCEEEEQNDSPTSEASPPHIPSPPSPILHITHLAPSLPASSTIDVVELDDAVDADELQPVLLDNEPLSCYLQRHRITPLHTLPAVQRPHSLDGAVEDEELLQAASAQAGPTAQLIPTGAEDASSPYGRAVLLPLRAFCWLLCPALGVRFFTTSRTDEQQQQRAVELTRAQWHFLCHRCGGRSASPVFATLTVPPPPTMLFPLPRIALLLYSTALLAALSMMVTAGLAYALSAASQSGSGIGHLALFSPLLLLLLVNWAAAYGQLRGALLWHSAQATLLSLDASTMSTSRVARRAILRVMEAEVVSKGYHLPLNAAHAVTMDHRQAAHMRQAIKLRHSASDCLRRHIAAVTETITALRTAQHSHTSEHLELKRVLQLLWSCADVCSDWVEAERVAQWNSCASASVSVPPHEIPSIAELQGQLGQLELLQTSLWAELSSLASSAHVDVRLLHSTLAHLALISNDSTSRLKLALCLRDAATPSSVALPPPLPAPSASSLLRIHHRLRSAQARLLLSFQRGPPSAGGASTEAAAEEQLVLSDLHYIRQAAHDVCLTCDELQRERSQRVQSEEKEEEAALLPSTSGPDGDASSLPRAEGGQSAVLAEMRGLRRRRAAAGDGAGLLFEGEGQWRVGGASDEEEEEGKEDSSDAERRQRRLRMADATAWPLAPSGPSFLSTRFSMVSELRSVLSHRPTRTFHTIEAGS